MKGIKFVIQNILPPKYAIKSDMQRLKQVLLNLLTNAVKHTLKGSIKVKIKFY